jgi:hypothetical protein
MRRAGASNLGAPMKYLPLVFLLLTASCATTTPAAEVVAPDTREMSRDDAVTAARSDAILRFRLADAAPVSVSRSGPFWLVALRGSSGSSLRYAISASDGSIHERTMIQ